MYLGLIAIARYHNVQKEVDILTCPNRQCQKPDNALTVANAPFCGYCGTKKAIRPFGKKLVSLATPIQTPGLVHYQDGYHCHCYTLAGEDRAALENRMGFEFYLDDGITELPSALDFTQALEQMRAQYHQLFIDAGYDSVEYVFGLLAPENEDD